MGKQKHNVQKPNRALRFIMPPTLKPRPNDRNPLRAFVQPVEMCCDMLGVVGSSLRMSNLSQQHPTCRNMSKQGGQTRATCYAQQCCDMLRWHVAIIWVGLKTLSKMF